jgi:hypothetical protein
MGASWFIAMTRTRSGAGCADGQSHICTDCTDSNVTKCNKEFPSALLLCTERHHHDHSDSLLLAQALLVSWRRQIKCHYLCSICGERLVYCLIPGLTL